MIKNKDREELLDFTYELLAENKVLLAELALLNKTTLLKTITSYILYPIHWIFYIRQYNHKLNTMNKLTKEQLVDTFNAINKYEIKKLSSLVYKDLFVNTTGIKMCGNCGVGLDRVHDDFQKTILAQIKTTYPDLIPKILFYSGKYASGDFYMSTIPFNTYHANEVILNKMKHEYSNLRSKGYVEQSSLIQCDIKTLTDYLDNRKNTVLTLDVQTVPEFDDLKKVPTMEVIKVEAVEDNSEKVTTNIDTLNVGSLLEDEKSPYNFIKEIEKKVPTNINDDEGEEKGSIDTYFKTVSEVQNKAVLSDEKEFIDIFTTNEVIVPKFDILEAYNMKVAGKSNSEIGEYFGVNYQFVNKRLKSHIEAVKKLESTQADRLNLIRPE